MRVSEYRIGFIGFGHMAQIIYRSIDQAKLIPRSQILFMRRDPEKIRKNEQEFGITATSLENLVSKSDLLFLCVRPQQAEPILKQLARFKVENKLFISILAGIRTAYFKKFLGSAAVIRAMPNQPAEVGEGMTILASGSQDDIEFRSLANLLFKGMGEVIELPEDLIDLTTGIAGSGPAYVFSLIEAAARLGEKGGVPYEKSLKIAAQTFLGSAKILLKEGVDVAELIQKIAVPNGTTEAGLKVFKETDVEKRFQAVMQAASDRSKAISEEFSR